VREFIPAEKERTLSLPRDELRAGHVAMTEILSMWSLITHDLSAKETAGVAQERLLEGLRSLRKRIVQQQGGDPALRTPRAPESDKRMSGSSSAPDDALAEELMKLWEIQEQPFTSQMPILGPLISAFRELWNSVATKWYVQPMLAQQVQFNGTVVRTLIRALNQYQDLHEHYWDDDALLAMLAEQCGRMSVHIDDLEERLARIKTQLLDASADARRAKDE
jgi:hypothetical protein